MTGTVSRTLLLALWGDHQNTNDNDSGESHPCLSMSQHRSKYLTCFIRFGPQARSYLHFNLGTQGMGS